MLLMFLRLSKNSLKIYKNKSLNAVAEEMVKRGRGELAKPHLIEKPAYTVVKPRAT